MQIVIYPKCFKHMSFISSVNILIRSPPNSFAPPPPVIGHFTRQSPDFEISTIHGSGKMTGARENKKFVKNRNKYYNK
jgi:hypothetical protein